MTGETTTDGQVRTGLVLAVACLCQLMVVLDMTVVNVALPSIRADLGFSVSSLQWVVNAYTLTFGGLLLLGGRAADLAGHRRAALTGLALFGVTSLLGGLARNSAELITARAAQGVAGAVLLPVSLTVIMATFPAGAARHRALAIWGATAGAGGAIGVLLGGVLATGLAFVPFSLGVIAGTVAAGRLIPRVGPRPPLLAGLVLAAVGVAWFGQVSPHGTFSSSILGPSIVASVGLGLCFVTVAATATSGVSPAEAGLASGLINTCRQCGGSIGLAVLVTVANTVARDRGGLPAAITAGYDRAFLVAGTLIAISAVMVLAFLRTHPVSGLVSAASSPVSGNLAAEQRNGRNHQ